MSRTDLPRVPPEAGYDAWAATYDAYDNPLVALEEPIVTRLVGDPRGRTVADIGCGTGRYAIRLARAGATVTAVDFSQGMLAELRRKAGDITTIGHDIRRGIPLPDASFELVLCCLMLEHMPDLDATIAELARVCRPRGAIIVSDIHPELSRRGVQARYRDSKTGQKVQIEGGGFRPVDAYKRASLAAGLKIDVCEGHYMTDEVIAQSASAAKYRGQPMLLTLRLLR